MSFAHQLKLSSRRKTVAIKVTRGEVFVYAPKDVCKASLARWLETKTAWVTEKVRQTANQQVQVKSNTPTTFSLFGLRYAIVFGDIGSHYVFNQDQAQLIIDKANLEPLNTVLEAIRIECLTEYLNERLQYWQAIMNVEIASVKVRFYKSRWGSCDSKGRLTFNTRLVMFPKELIDYVIVHELAHRKYLNHSAQFWSLVGLYFPNYQFARNEIKRLQKSDE